MQNINLKPLFSDINSEPTLFSAQKHELESKWKRQIIYIFLLCFAITAFSIISYKAYKYSSHPESIEDIPLVRKDMTELREIPSDPGGEQFSNQDKLIYNNLIDNTVKKTQNPKVVETSKAKPVEKVEPKVYKKAKVQPKTETPLTNVFDVLDE